MSKPRIFFHVFFFLKELYAADVVPLRAPILFYFNIYRNIQVKTSFHRTFVRTISGAHLAIHPNNGQIATPPR